MPLKSMVRTAAAVIWRKEAKRGVKGLAMVSMEILNQTSFEPEPWTLVMFAEDTNPGASKMEPPISANDTDSFFPADHGEANLPSPPSSAGDIGHSDESTTSSSDDDE